MKKAFVWDPFMRSSALKYDPCISVSRKKCEIKCDDCKVTLISDRFLGKEFHENILRKIGCSRGRYPYVIIADSLGCNLNCWFCYAYKFISDDPSDAAKNNCLVSFISPERLAEQFGCKIRKISNFNEWLEAVNKKELHNEKEKIIKHLKLKLPLMRIRISGGEPLFSTSKTLIGVIEDDYIESTVLFWLNFFEHLDFIIGNLKKEKILNLINEEEIRYKVWRGGFPIPTCISKKRGRLNIRFDTNGIIFRRERIVDLFLGGLFKLYKNNKLNNLYIEFDYSFKGTTPVEFQWSQKQNLPVNLAKNSFDYEIFKHPQIKGYFNLFEKIKEYSNEDNAFSDCIGITVEKGINHAIGIKNKVYIYSDKALDWDKFSKKTGINFSPIDNTIDVFNWRNNKPKKYYFERGASIKVISNEEVFDLAENPDFKELHNFISYHEIKDIFIYPIDKNLDLTNKSKIRKNKSGNFDSTDEINNKIFGWVLSGTMENWRIGIRNRKWGISKKNNKLWEKIRPNDTVLFYVTRPISKIIGYGIVENKIVEEFPFWPNEVKEKKTIYPLRITLKNLKYLPFDKWNSGLRKENLQIIHGINPIHNEMELKKFINKLESMVNNV